MTRISLVAAVAENGVIGRAGTMPWHLPADLVHFRRVTLGKSVVMGRHTYEAIGRPLPGRRNIVVTRNPDWFRKGVTRVEGIEAALAACAGEAEVMVIGGGEIYQAFLPRAQQIYLTRVQARPRGDVRFPNLHAGEWRELECIHHPADADNPYAIDFVILERDAQP